MRIKIKASKYWNTLLKIALLKSGYLPKDIYYLITTSKDLEQYITSEIVKRWYKNNNYENLKFTLEELYYTRNICTNYFSQSRYTLDLEECIETVFNIQKIEYINDIEAYIEIKRSIKNESRRV